MKQITQNKKGISRDENHHFIVHVKDKMESLGIQNGELARAINKTERSLFNYLNEYTMPSDECRRKILDYIYSRSVYSGFYQMSLKEFRTLLSMLYVEFKGKITQEELAKVAGKSQSEISRYMSEPSHDVVKMYYELKYVDVKTQFNILYYYRQQMQSTDGGIIDTYGWLGEYLDYWLFDYRNMKAVHKNMEKYIICGKQIYDSILNQFYNNCYSKQLFCSSEFEDLAVYYENAELIFKTMLLLIEFNKNNQQSIKNKINRMKEKCLDVVKVAEKHVKYIISDNDNREAYLEALEYLREPNRMTEYIGDTVCWLQSSKYADCYDEMLWRGTEKDEYLDDYSSINSRFENMSVLQQKIVLEYFEVFESPYEFSYEIVRSNTEFIESIRRFETSVIEEVKLKLEKIVFEKYHEAILDEHLNSLITKYHKLILMAENGYQEYMEQEDDAESLYIEYEKKLGSKLYEYPVLETIETMLQFTSQEWYLQMLYVIGVYKGYDAMKELDSR